MLTLRHAEGGQSELTVPHTFPAQSGSAFYFGVIDTKRPFTQVTFTNTLSKIDGFGFDDMTIGRREQVRSKIFYPDLDPDSSKD